MANLLQNLLSSFAKDVVAVFDQDMVQVFPRARTMRASVRPQSRPMEHPLENGAIITDHRIILPVEIELSMMLQAADYQETYKTISQYYSDGTLLIVQTKAGVFNNQMIATIPSEEDAEQYDAIAIVIKLKQVQFVDLGAQPNVANPANAPTVNRGIQQGTAPTTNQTTSATDAIMGAA